MSFSCQFRFLEVKGTKEFFFNKEGKLILTIKIVSMTHGFPGVDTGALF